MGTIRLLLCFETAADINGGQSGWEVFVRGLKSNYELCMTVNE